MVFPVSYRVFADFLKENDEVEWDLIEQMMDSLAILQTTRGVIMVTVSKKYTKEDESGEVKEINEKHVSMEPEKVYKWLVSYNETLIDFRFHYAEKKEVPVRGACDTRPHDVTMSFQGQNDELLTLRVATVKSSGENCLINALSQANTTLGRGFRAQKVREELQIQAGAIPADCCFQIAAKLGVTFSLYTIKDNKLSMIAQSEIRSERHVDLLAQGGHYYKVQSDVRQLIHQQPKESLQIQDSEEVFEKVTDRVITFDHGVEVQDLETVQFDETLVDPSLEDFLAVVESKRNVLLVGAGGCGKTFLLKKMARATFTATTACAADLLGGCTIQSYILKNRKPAGELLVCDEVSMMGSLLFE